MPPGACPPWPQCRVGPAGRWGLPKPQQQRAPPKPQLGRGPTLQEGARRPGTAQHGTGTAPAWYRHATAVPTGWAGGYEVRSWGWGAPEPWEQGTRRMGTLGMGRWGDTRATQRLSLGGHWSWGTPAWGHRGGDTAARGDASPRAPSHPDSFHPSIATGLSPSALHTLVHVHARLRTLAHACMHSDMPEPPPACSHTLAHSRAHTGTLLPHTHGVVGGG